VEEEEPEMEGGEEGRAFAVGYFCHFWGKYKDFSEEVDDHPCLGSYMLLLCCSLEGEG